MGLNGLLIPFGYVAGIINKIRIMRKNKFKSTLSKDFKDNRVSDICTFVALGIPLLILAWFTDSYYFFVHLYSMDVRKLDKSKIKKISYSCFCMFEALVNREVRVNKKKTINAVELLESLREEMGVMDHMRSIIFNSKPLQKGLEITEDELDIEADDLFRDDKQTASSLRAQVSPRLIYPTSSRSRVI